jgi:hypothetical protein
MQDHSYIPIRGKRSGRRIALSLSVAAGLVSAFLAQPAQATTDEPEPPVQPFVTPIGTVAPAAQQHISAMADEVGSMPAEELSLVGDTVHALGKGNGYAGQEVDPDTRTIDVYFRGDTVPGQVTSYIARHGRDVTVKVHAGAKFTREEAQAAAGNVVWNEGLVEQAGIQSVAVNHDGSGFRVNMLADAPNDEVKQQIVEAAGIPTEHITYVENQGEMVNLASRTNDASPWSGGARIVMSNGGLCSTGFSVLIGGYGRLLTANHCDPSGDRTVRSGGGTIIAYGSGVSTYPSIDSNSIDPRQSPATAEKIYTGHWASTSRSTVKNWASNNNGDYVCSGGATTGTHCGTIIDDSVGWPGLSGGWYVKARGNGSYMAGQGDSGGPIYRGVTGGAQARGTLIGGYGYSEAYCSSSAINPDATGARCFRDIVYLPISVALNSWGYSLDVG